MTRLKYLLIILSLALFFSGAVRAELELISEADLSEVSGRAGLSLVMDTRVSFYADSFAFSDSDSDPVNWIRFNGFSMDDGNGGGFKVSNIDTTPYKLDVGTTEGGRSILSMNLSPLANPVYFHVEDLVFCEQSLGRLDLNGFTLAPDSFVRFSHHMEDGSSGLEFDAGIALDVDSFEYTYNTSNELFGMRGIHIGGTATGDARTPSNWEMTGNFSIGDLDAKSAGMDIGTDNDGVTHLVFSLPLSGSLRIEEVSMGPNSFGPMVLDDIRVHRLTVSFSP